MAIIKKQRRAGKIVIDISGPDGNAYALLAYARDYGRQLGFSKEKQAQVSAEMKSGDYENLLQVFDSYFGEVIDLAR